jgi:hypothetical protein
LFDRNQGFVLLPQCKGGKANLGVSDVEYNVVIGHEGVIQDPKLGTDAVVSHDAADVVIGALRDWSKVQALCHGEVLVTEGERNGGESEVAGKM